MREANYAEAHIHEENLKVWQSFKALKSLSLKAQVCYSATADIW